jgi:cyclopropane fatty-acyl-phospholipid synthase-like methyltransferase
MRILELACGYGASIEFWTKQFGVFSVDVIDIRPKCLSAIKDLNPPGLGLCLTGSADDLELFLKPKGPLQLQNYDAVVCVDAAYHFSQLPAVFAAASKLLKPDGRLVWTNFLDIHGQRPGFLRRKLLNMAGIPPHAILTQKELSNQLTEQNLSLETLVALNSEVLGGFAKHVERRRHEVHIGAKLSPAWWKISATGLAGAQLCKSGFLEYSLIGAVKVP